MYIKYLTQPDFKQNVNRGKKRHPANERKRLMREWLWGHQHYRCFWCWKELSFPETSLDHLQPKSRGGKDVLCNFVVACKWCNEHRGCKTPRETIAWLRDRIAPLACWWKCPPPSRKDWVEDETLRHVKKARGAHPGRKVRKVSKKLNRQGRLLRKRKLESLLQEEAWYDLE